MTTKKMTVFIRTYNDIHLNPITWKSVTQKIVKDHYNILLSIEISTEIPYHQYISKKLF